MQNTSAVGTSVDSTRWIGERLDSWKEVASFFRREVRTVQLWEKSEGLPVRRQHHKKLCTVYAYRRELEAWWVARSNLHIVHPRCAAGTIEDRHTEAVEAPEGGRGRILCGEFETLALATDDETLREKLTHFCKGLRSDLVVELGRFGARLVVPPARKTGSGSALPDWDMTREPDADFLLSGNMRHYDRRVLVLVQVLRASDRSCVWSERFETGLDNIVTAQVELARAICRAFAERGPQSREATVRDRVSSYELALRACQLGTYYWQRRSRSALHKALSYFKDAIELEPRCAEAYAGLADTYVSLSYNHLMPARQAADKARESVDAALRLDGRSVTVRNALVNMLMHCSWSLPAAERVCRKVIDGGIHDSRTLQLYSCLMSLRSRHQDAIRLALESFRLEPHSDLINGQVALAYFYAGDYGNALSFIQQTIRLQPQYPMGYALLGRTEAQLGHWDRAIDAFRRGSETSGLSAFMKALLAFGYAGSGDRFSANALLHELEQDHGDCFPAYDVSAVHAALNQEQKALQQIHKALGVRDMKMIFVQHDPRFARLRNSAGFQRIASGVFSDTPQSAVM
jgi:serine/threonine-protein kinase